MAYQSTPFSFLNPPQDIIEVNRSEFGIGQPKAILKPRPVVRNYIAVSGNIGSGKSSLVDFLCHKYAIDPYFEPNDDNPYLTDFYKDMSRWSFQSQIYFLTAKFKLHLELESKPASVIQDRTIWEDAEIFAENLYRRKKMSARDYRTYRQLYESIKDQIRPPDLMIYLHCPVDTVKKRIKLRGRTMEKNIPTSYLKQLNKLYEQWIENYTLSPLVILRTDKLDYITDWVDQYDILNTIEKYLIPPQTPTDLLNSTVPEHLGQEFKSSGRTLRRP